MTGFSHIPVMADPITELLGPALAGPPPTWLIDATLGLGGHTEALLQAYPDVCVLGIDRDPQALAAATERLHGHGHRFRTYRGVFDEIPDALATVGQATCRGVLFDLGVSSLQLDSDARGFAYSRDTSLDMRMDSDAPGSAADVINEYTAEELARVMSQYGEERFARRIAAAIVRERAARPITTTGRLSDICAAAIPAAARRKGHPAKRVFQGLRIEVNDELGALRRGLTAAVRSTEVTGRIVVLSYHSLEDRIVKRAFATGAAPDVPPGLPVVPVERRPFLRLITNTAPDAAEIAANPRAASARLRVAEVIGPVPSEWRVA